MAEAGPLQKLENKVECLSKRMRNKVPWVGAGVVVAILTVIAMLTYSAYSGEQKRQSEDIAENSAQVQELKTNVKVMQSEFGHVRSTLEDLKHTQQHQTEVILQKLEEVRKESGGTK